MSTITLMFNAQKYPESKSKDSGTDLSSDEYRSWRDDALEPALERLNLRIESITPALSDQSINVTLKGANFANKSARDKWFAKNASDLSRLPFKFKTGDTQTDFNPKYKGPVLEDYV